MSITTDRLLKVISNGEVTVYQNQHDPNEFRIDGDGDGFGKGDDFFVRKCDDTYVVSSNHFTSDMPNNWQKTGLPFCFSNVNKLKQMIANTGRMGRIGTAQFCTQ